MKVPLLRYDIDKKRFSALTKFVARNWPDAPCNLSYAQETVAKCFGYANLHDAQKNVSDKLPANVPSLEVVVENVASTLTSQFGLDQATAYDFAGRWPIFRLRFCKSPQSAGVTVMLHQHCAPRS